MPFSLDLPLWAYPVLFLTGLVAGTVDAIAGGGGLIALPVLLGFGIPPALALGTSKLQSTFGVGAAAWTFMRLGVVKLRDCRVGIVCTAIGAVAGAGAVRLLDPQLLADLIPGLIGAIVLLLIFRPQLGETSRHHRLEPTAFYFLFGVSLGFYDGFFGPGTGTFWTIACVTLLGHNFVEAAAHTKVMNLVSNVAALIFFAAAGSVLWVPGLVMGAGQFLGGRIGSKLAVKRGARFVRPIFLAVAAAVALKLIYARFTAVP